MAPGAPLFSPDGNQYWDGQRWQSAISPDGRWRWDGSRWVALPPGQAPPPVAPVTPAHTPRTPTPRSGSWQVMTPQARTVATPVPLTSTGQGGALPGVDGPARKRQRVVGFRREPTSWTNPLVLFATCYFVGGGIYGVLLTAALAPEYHDRLDFALRASSQLSSRDADNMATAATSLLVSVLVFFSVLAILLGLLSFRRIRLVFYLQMLGNFFSLFGFLIALTTPADQKEVIAPNIFWSSVIFDFLGGVLFFLMLFARRAYGPWGLRRVPVYADIE